MKPSQLPSSSNCLAWSRLLGRRDMLRIGALSIAATAVPDLTAKERLPRSLARSVIVLWMAGGVTHIDSFDPKSDAPQEIRGSLTSIPTTLPGVRFCETLPHLAQQVHRLAVLRSFSHDTNDHFIGQAYALSGRKVTPAQVLTEPNVGAIVNKLLGPRGGLPGYIAVPGTTRPGPPPTNLFTAGWLGREYGPFGTGGIPRNEDFTARVREAPEEEFNQQAIRLPLELNAERMNGRATLRQRLDSLAAEADRLPPEAAMQYQPAFNMLLSPSVRKAFDLHLEPVAVRDRYGATKIGRRCLLARRLVEAGARFVLVDYGYDPEFGNLWDNHNAPSQAHPPICSIVKLPWHLAGTDRALAALIDDLAVRGMLEETLVVFLTEFGRTPKINKEGGRDHWGPAGSLCFAGGGIRGGQVIGGTDKHAAYPTTLPHGPWDVAASIYHALGIAPETILYDRQNRPQFVLPEGHVIPGLFGS